MTLRRVDVVVPLFLALLACKKFSGSSGGAGEACTSDTDCKNGFLCVSEACIPKATAEKIRGAESSGGSHVVGDKLDVEWRGSVYPATVTEVQADGKVKIHYDGWGAEWDEVVGADRIKGKRGEATAAAPGGGEPALVAPPGAIEVMKPGAAAGGSKSPKDIPEIPTGRSNPPTSAEWAATPITNTQGANSWAPDCTSKIVREWLQVNCVGKVLGYEKMSGFGQKSVDYFESFVPGKIGSFVVRLKRGKTMQVRICREKGRASLFVNWPSGKDRPVHVALAKGPKCDGSDFGASAKKAASGDKPLCDCSEGWNFPTDSCGKCNKGHYKCGQCGDPVHDDLHQCCLCDTDRCRMN